MIGPDEITDLFTHADGSFRLARWARPIVPVVFGVEEPSLGIVKGALEAIVSLAGHGMAETDPELGANLMFFFFRDWSELQGIPDIDRLVPGIGALSEKLRNEGASQYRHFRFEPDGAIRAVFVFLCMESGLSDVPAGDLALAQAAQIIVLWGQSAFADRSPLVRAADKVVLRPEIGALIRAIYDPAMPVASNDAVQSLRLAARIGQN